MRKAQSLSSVQLVVALWSEAKPLVTHFGLQPLAPERPFRVYQSADISLIVSGIGKTSAAAATSYLFALQGGVRDRAWINVGVGGHRSLSAGEVVLAHKVVDHASDRVWYPPLVFDAPVPTATVRTVDRVEEEYADDVVYEMEAAGFYATATRLSTAELVHVLKIVSDGPKHPSNKLTARDVTRLVSVVVGEVERLVEEVRAVADNLAAPRPVVEIQPWLERWHFTVTQEHRLRRLLARLRVVDSAFREPDGAIARAAELADAAAVLKRLEEDLRASSPSP